jgi:hypothetical protein
MKIILKVDDWWGTGSLTIPGFVGYFKACKDLGVKINLGLIGLGLTNKPEIAKQFLDENDWVEIYNHSYNHIIKTDEIEFFNKPVEFQRDSIFRTQLGIAEKLGRICKVIGFPANAFDYTTIEVLREFPLLNFVFAYPQGKLYNNIKGVGKKIIDVNGYRRFEKPPRIVSLEEFKAEYSEDKEYTAYQFHPVNYTKDDIYNFQTILEFLINKGNKFVFASEL